MQELSCHNSYQPRINNIKRKSWPPATNICICSTTIVVPTIPLPERVDRLNQRHRNPTFGGGTIHRCRRSIRRHFFRCGVRKNRTQTNFDSAFKPSSRRLLNITSPNMTRFQQTDREVRIFYRRVNIPCRHRIRSIKELLRRFYVSRCGPEPKYSQRIGLNGGTTKIACAR